MGAFVDHRQYQATIVKLLDDSPITSPDVIRDIRESVAVGEIGLAFNTLCSWIFEDSLPIAREYHARLDEIAESMGSAALVERLRELISEPQSADDKITPTAIDE